ncbi:hypothetical protein PV733_36975 [Streptomyces europaeiscabiei]|uniref:hypothetical protein n=1 Tax=Streptomyces europaeiscabiei TaxID=146819 RepID=UPI0029B9259B|nr:hypothetical protein [Streptomyces europaeiscabiei]MDX3714426.1 hypothetical protein [Streptomyces europaeiscabiei]
MSRDYIADMNTAIEDAIPDGDYTAPLVAADLVERLRAEDPDLLTGWLEVKASVFLADAVARKSNSRRQLARVGAPRRAFAEAARSFGTDGDATVMRPFAAEYVVDEDNTRRTVARMTAADCLFVAARYEDTARQAKLEAAFHRAIAKKVGKGTVGDAFTEEQYLTMYRSVTGRSEGPGLAAA